MEHSNFVRLPPELWNDIYERLLTFDGPIRLDGTAELKSITETCREIRFESRKFFWADNTFVHTCVCGAGYAIENAGQSTSDFLSRCLGSEILNVAGSISVIHRPFRKADDSVITIYSGTQAAERNPEVNISMWERHMVGFGRTGPNSTFLRAVLGAYDHLGFELYVLRADRSSEQEDVAPLTANEPEASQEFPWIQHSAKHYEFCVILPKEDEEFESAESESECSQSEGMKVAEPFGAESESESEEEIDEVGEEEEDGEEDEVEGEFEAYVEEGSEGDEMEYIETELECDNEVELDDSERRTSESDTVEGNITMNEESRDEAAQNTECGNVQIQSLPGMSPATELGEVWNKRTAKDHSDSETESETDSETEIEESEEESDDEI